MSRFIFFGLIFIYGNDLLAQVSIDAHKLKITEDRAKIIFSILPESGFYIYEENLQELVSGPMFKSLNDTLLGNKLISIGKPIVIKDLIFGGRNMSVFDNRCLFETTVANSDSLHLGLKGIIKLFVGNGVEFKSIEIPVDLSLNNSRNDLVKIHLINIFNSKSNLVDCGMSDSFANLKNDQPIFQLFLIGLFAGLLALFTPCVFPMVPVTVSFFSDRGKDRRQGIRNGLLYAGCILLIYLLASLPFHLMASVKPELLNNIATSIPLNLVFFIVFLVFALSFFGLFELRLPYFITGSAGKKSGIGSIGGIFFMALTLAIVSFSCTGPILGSLLVGSVSGGAWLLTAGLAGFGLALALPFGLFAMFPQLLAKLPKSGAWMTTFKVVLAFVELGLAFKFLSNADLVGHWGILKREVFLAVWILISVCLTGYLIDLPWLVHYGRFRVTVGRWVGAGVAVCFAVYLCSGLNGSNLALLSGFPPPVSYSIYESKSKNHVKPDFINDYARALELAKAQHKNILIDFTGWACVNCRKMEENVWTKPEVAEYIKENFILVSLYVDDKAKLPVSEQTDEFQTVGEKWAKLQVSNFKQATQPLYVVLNEKEQLVTSPVGYTPEADKYLSWLKCSNGGK